VRLRLRSDRLLLGFRGLGLLRGWPFQDPEEAAGEIAAIAMISARGDEQSESQVEALDAGEAFTAWSATYDPTVNTLIAAEEPVVRAMLEEVVPGKALDLASGTGRLSKILRDLGNEVVALDGSLAMLRRARAGRTAEVLVCADLHGLPFPDWSFDVVACGLSLTHVRDLGPPIAEIARIVRPGGNVVLSDIHPLAVATGAHAFFEREDGSPAVTTNEVHWPSAYLEAFRTSGFLVERCGELSRPDLRADLERFE